MLSITTSNHAPNAVDWFNLRAKYPSKSKLVNNLHVKKT